MQVYEGSGISGFTQKQWISAELFQQLKGLFLSRRSDTQCNLWKVQMGKLQSWRLGYIPRPCVKTR